MSRLGLPSEAIFWTKQQRSEYRHVTDLARAKALAQAVQREKQQRKHQ